MINKLRNNYFFRYIFPLIAAAIIAVPLWFLKEAFVNWNPLKVAFCDIAILIGFCLFAFWFLVAVRKNESNLKKILVETLFALIYCAIWLFAGMAVVNFTSNATNAYLFVCAIISATVLISFGFAISRICEDGKITVIALIVSITVCMCSTFFAFSRFYEKNSEIVVKKQFSVLGGMADGGGKDLKVVLLAGQSNATGVASSEYLAKKTDAETFNEYLGGYNNVMINFITENGSNSSNGCFVPVKLGQGASNAYFGPEIGIAETFSDSFPSETIVILKYSWGGSNLHTQWRSPSSDGETGELYTAFVNFVSSSMEYLLSVNYNAKIEAMCWMQGGSDSTQSYAANYQANEKNLVEDVRKDLSKYSRNGGMYFIDALIFDSPLCPAHEVVNNAKTNVSMLSDLNILIDASDLEYDKEPENNPDIAHYDSTAMVTLGRRFGLAAVSVFNK